MGHDFGLAPSCRWVFRLEALVALWEVHGSKPSTNVLMPPKPGALREVACDNIYPPAVTINKNQYPVNLYMVLMVYH